MACLVFIWGLIRKTIRPPWPPSWKWFSSFKTKLLEISAPNLVWRFIRSMTYLVLILGSLWQTKWPPWPPSWKLFWLSESKTARDISTIFYMKVYWVIGLPPSQKCSFLFWYILLPTFYINHLLPSEVDISHMTVCFLWPLSTSAPCQISYGGILFLVL